MRKGNKKKATKTQPSAALPKAMKGFPSEEDAINELKLVKKQIGSLEKALNWQFSAVEKETLG